MTPPRLPYRKRPAVKTAGLFGDRPRGSGYLRTGACLALLPVALLAQPSAAQAFDLSFPVDCTPGDSCFIQNYFDHGPGPSVLDFHCGALSYDGHDGTDIAVPTVGDLRRGVEIRATGPGKVLGTRNNVADNPADVETPIFPEGQDCGNGVVIDHGDGWQSQYCHMAEGSITVTTGDMVEAGTRLGLMGLSGNTQFPHLHLTLRKDGQALDPFAPAEAVNCLLPDAAAPDGLWQQPLTYEAGGIIGTGIATRAVDFSEVKAGLPLQSSLSPDAPALVVWAHLFGTRSGDEVRLVITGPEGVLVDQSQLLERSQARAFRMLGQKLASGSQWPAGEWTATTTHLRDGKPISTGEQRFTISQ